ncbi:MAG: ankyrin repeat domain-containing protein [Armatimonadota bacterium]
MARSKFLFILFVTVLLQSLAYAQTDTQSTQTKPVVVPNTALVLPADCNVKVRWISPPLDPQTVGNASWYSLCFAVDTAGRPWIGYQEDTIINPVRQYRFKLPGRYNSFACLENGAFLAATDADLGFAVPPAKIEMTYDNIPTALFQPISDLPIPECKLYPGAGNCIYLAGRLKSGGSEVYLLRPDKSGIRGFTKVFTSKSEIRSVTGDGDNTFIAIENLIVKVTGTNGAVTKVITEPREYILTMAYNPQIGLFYSTTSRINYIGAKGNIPLMTVPDSKIYLRDGSLYILLSKSLGIIALDNIPDLKRFGRPVKEIPVTDSKDVKFTGIRIFEAGNDMPPVDDRKYVSEFSYQTTRFVYCQAEFDNLQYNKKLHKQIVTMELYREGFEGLIDSNDIYFGFKPEYSGLWGWSRFGANEPGQLYPGIYTVKTYLNGAMIDESKFTVTGDPTLLECAGRHDTAMVSKLIKGGADVNAANSNGITPLMLAALSSDPEITKLLLDGGANVNAKDSEGETALTMDGETWEDEASVAQLLLAAGADVNAQGKDGYTALHRAVSKRKKAVIDLLIKYKANPNILNKDGAAPIHSTWFFVNDGSSAAIVDQLLANGANIEAKDSNGMTVLFKAIDAHNPEIVSILIKRGVDVNATCKVYGNTEYSPLGYALENFKTFKSYRLDRMKSRQIIQLLQENGADLNVSEFHSVYFSGIEQVLDFPHISRLLEMSEPAARNLEPKDPALRKVAIRGLLNSACRQISDAKDEYGYYQALYLLEEASNRARKWGLSSSCPEVSFNIGITWMCIGNTSNTKKFLQEYIDIAPTGSCAARAREIIRQLK